MQDFHLAVAGPQIVDRQKRTVISQRIQFRYLGSIGSDRGGFLGHLIDRHHHFDGTAAIAADTLLGGAFLAGAFFTADFFAAVFLPAFFADDFLPPPSFSPRPSMSSKIGVDDALVVLQFLRCTVGQHAAIGKTVDIREPGS